MSALICHPNHLAKSVTGVFADIARDGDDLMLSYRIDAPSGSLVWPVDGPADRRDELWLTTCFEVFLAPNPGADYFEYNFAPSGAWAAYRFDAHRSVGMRNAVIARAPIIKPDGYGVTVSCAPPSDLAGPWRVALTVVVEEQGGPKSLWSLKHPPGKPDFHHPDGFVLTL